jgi:hypothetical protein
MSTPAADEQEAAAAARLRFLSQCARLVGRPAEFTLVDGGMVRAGAVAGFSVSQPRTFAVRELATPLGVAPAATLRAADVAAVVFDVDETNLS